MATGSIRLNIPGLIQAEAFTAMGGFELEDTTDTGGGKNTGFADPGDFLAYDVIIETAGRYVVDYRLATLNGSEGYTVSVDGVVIDTVAVEPTGGWQSWVTLRSTVDLPAGEQTLRFDSIGGEWNMNWFEFALDEATGFSSP